MLFPDQLETDRLQLEQLCHANVDLQEFYRICSSDDAIEEVTQYMPWGPHETIKETKDFIDAIETEWEDGESATYIIRPNVGEANAGKIAGNTGLEIDWERRTGTLGIWLRKPFWGRGYSGERAAALMAHAFEHLDLEIVAVTHNRENEQSQRAIEKYIEAHGGQRDGIIRNGLAYQDGTVVDEVRYTVAKEEYAESTSS
jgi:RimJ/RimL family protein N-acetyltransferase